MVELYIIRHGEAKSCEEETGDEERPLTKKGKEKIKDIAKGMKDLGVSFDIIISSPLLRSAESAEIVNSHCGKECEVVITDLLKPDSSYSELIDFLNDLEGAEKIAIVGHEPFLSGFASYCLAKSKSSFINLKKGGALILESERPIKPGKSRLSWLMEPKQLVEL